MRYIKPLLILLISTVLFAQSGKKANTGPDIDLRKGVFFEVAPYAGAMGGSGMFGLRLGMNYSALNVEVSGEQVIGKTANTYPIMLNFMLNLSKTGRFLPYVGAGGGLLMTVPTNAIGSQTVSSLGASLGVGTRIYLTKQFGFRAEFRQLATNITDEFEAREEFLTFQEISLGVTFMFN
ncbi:MAG: outer membrane protein [Calditrichia bacterium]